MSNDVDMPSSARNSQARRSVGLTSRTSLLPPPRTRQSLASTGVSSNGSSKVQPRALKIPKPLESFNNITKSATRMNEHPRQEPKKGDINNLKARLERMKGNENV